MTNGILNVVDKTNQEVQLPGLHERPTKRNIYYVLHSKRFILIFILIFLAIVGGGVIAAYLGINRHAHFNTTSQNNTTSQTAGYQQQGKIAQKMQELGCASPASCMAVCAKPQNHEKCQSMMQGMNTSGMSGSIEHMNFLSKFNSADVPPVTANVMDINRIFAISHFRSGAGHDYSYSSWDGETCRSMKHYFNLGLFNMGQNQVNGMPKRSTLGPGETNINIYAPFDGTIIANESEQTPIGTQVHIASAKNSHYYVRLFHIDLLPSLSVGSKVKSGELVGTIGPKDGMDVSYEARLLDLKVVYLSIFDYMTPQAFVPYAALGYKPSDFVLTRAQADAKGYQCNGEQFSNSPGLTPSSGQLEGYVSIRPNPYNYLFYHNQPYQQGQNLQNRSQ